jgi:hypothetical protein
MAHGIWHMAYGTWQQNMAIDKAAVDSSTA